MGRELTERQQKFLAVLFDEAGGDVVQAKKLAGYSDNSNTSEVVKSMKDEIMEATQLYMSRNAPKAIAINNSRIVKPDIRFCLGVNKHCLFIFMAYRITASERFLTSSEIAC